MLYAQNENTMTFLHFMALSRRRLEVGHQSTIGDIHEIAGLEILLSRLLVRLVLPRILLDGL